MNIAKLIEAMGKFSANAKSDTVSVEVARITHKLAHTGLLFESNYSGSLTAHEKKIINMFIKADKQVA